MAVSLSREATQPAAERKGLRAGIARNKLIA